MLNVNLSSLTLLVSSSLFLRHVPLITGNDLPTWICESMVETLVLLIASLYRFQNLLFIL